MASTLIQNIKTLWQTDNGTRKLVSGKDMSEIPHINNAWLLMENDKITGFGEMNNAPQNANTIFDATDKMVLPAFAIAILIWFLPQIARMNLPCAFRENLMKKLQLPVEAF